MAPEQVKTHVYKDLSAQINSVLPKIAPWARAGAVVHLADTKPGIPSGTPAWYDLGKGDIYIHMPSVLPASLLENHKKLVTRTGGGFGSKLHITLEKWCNAVADTIEGSSDDLFSTSSWRHSKIFDDALMNIIGGLIQHEAAHSAWSGWMVSAQERLNALPPAVLAVITMFEELRIESRAIAKDITNGFFLRASYGWLLATTDMSRIPSISARDLAGLWALSYGRSIAGVIDPSEATDIDMITRYTLTDNVVNELQSILELAIAAKTNSPYGCCDQLAAYARRWLELVGTETSGAIPESFESAPGDGGESGSAGESEAVESDDASGASSSGEAGESGEEGHEPGEGSGSSDGDGGDEGLDAEGSAETVMKVTIEDNYDIKEGSDEDATKVAEAGSTETTRGHGYSNTIGDEFSAVSDSVEAVVKAVTAMKESFSKKRPPRTTLSDPRRAAARLFRTPRTSSGWREVAPSGATRNKVVAVAHRLELVAMPAVSTARVPSAVPPGRLDMRAAVRKSADRAAGRISTVEPWKKKARTHAPIRPTTVAVMTDVSGSMKWAQNIVAEFAYVYSNAGRRISAKTAAVTFGATVELVARPGEIATTLQVRTADDGHEWFDMAAASLDGMLNLTGDTRAVRVVLVVSDGYFVKVGEAAKATQWLDQWSKAGVHVVWIGANAANTVVNHILNSPTAKNVHLVDMSKHGDHSGYTFKPHKTFDAVELTLKKIEELSV